MAGDAAVAALYRYPVKSMAAEAVGEAGLSWFGLPGDRRYAFVRGDDRTDFPWLTIRQVRDMTRYEARADPADPDGGPVTVRTPDGRTLAADDEDLRDTLAAAYGKPVGRVRSFRGLFDMLAVSLLGSATAAAVAPDGYPLRFRPNLVVDGLEPFAEEAWVGRTLQIGDTARVRIDERDSRCMIVNVDPQTAERDPRVLRTVAQTRGNLTGIYGSVERPGPIRVGDPIVVL